jgi:hypothetical protein
MEQDGALTYKVALTPAYFIHGSWHSMLPNPLYEGHVITVASFDELEDKAMKSG